MLDACESEEERSMEMFESESDVVSSLLLDILTDTTDAEVVVVKPVGPDIPLSLLDDADIPDGSGMCRLETGGVSPVDARECMRIRGFPVLPTLSVEVAVCMSLSSVSVISIGSGVCCGLAGLSSGMRPPTEETSEMEDGVLLMAVLLEREAVLEVLDSVPS